VRGAIPLAPTIYEYSQLRRQRRRKAVSYGVRAQVDRRLSDPQDLDAVKQRARQQTSPGAAVGLLPGLGQLADVADGNVGRDVLGELRVLRRRLLAILADHRPLHGRGASIAEVTGHRAIAIARSDPALTDWVLALHAILSKTTQHGE
jgi:hypothetical protein